jgi:hypothetical protein
MSSKVYPIDISGIKSIGTEEWMNNYYVPVTGKEFQDIYNKVFALYVDNIKQHNDDVTYWISISNIAITVKIAQYILDYLRLLRLKEEGYEYIIGEEKKKIPEFIHINGINKITTNLSLQERIKNIIRTVKYNVSNPIFIIKNLPNFSEMPFIIGSKSQVEVVAFCKANKIDTFHLPLMLFARKTTLDSKDPQVTKVLEFIRGYLIAISKEYPVIDNLALKQLSKEVEEFFIQSLLFFQMNLNVFRKHKPKTLLTTVFGLEVYRLFCSAWRYAGGEVIGFVHGSSYCNSYLPGIISHYLLLVNQCVTLSEGHKELLQHAREDFSCGLRTGSITHTKQNHYSQLYNKLQKNRPVKNIKKVMLIGFPMSKFYYCFFPGGFAFAQLDMEIRLAKLLRKKGYYVIYKPHPMTMNEIEGIFDNYVDEIVEDEYENVYDIADCVMFGDYSTSTFGFSLLTNRPIVLIDIKGNYRFPKAFELLNKRCSIVMAELDGSGRINFDENKVLNAVEESINNINYDILYEYFL